LTHLKTRILVSIVMMISISARSQEPDLNTLVENYINLNGGREKVESVRSIYFKFRCIHNRDTFFYVYKKLRPDKMVITLDGPVTDVRKYNQGKALHLFNGINVPISLKELDEMRLDAKMFPLIEYTNQVVYHGEKPYARGYYEVELRTDVTSLVYYFDKKTSQLHKILSDDGAVAEFVEYMTVDGIPVPKLTIYNSPRSPHPIRYETIEMKFNPLFDEKEFEID
jgi:hypothetical protein